MVVFIVIVLVALPSLVICHVFAGEVETDGADGGETCDDDDEVGFDTVMRLVRGWERVLGVRVEKKKGEGSEVYNENSRGPDQEIARSIYLNCVGSVFCSSVRMMH